MAQISGPAVAGFDGNTSEVSDSQKHALGRRAHDNAGNEYVYVDFQEACITGEWVAFNSAYAASQLTNTSRGFVGVVEGNVSASDRFGWVMVRGIRDEAWVTSESSAAGQVVAYATTDIGAIATIATSAGNVGVFGVYLAGSPDTSASSDAGIAGTSLHGHATVILNYPFISGATLELTS